MRRFFRRISPSMFQRRLMLLVLACAMVTLVLGFRVAQLGVVEGALWRQRAESALIQSNAIPTRRGPILDRHGHVLAEDVPSYDLAVRYTLIDGTWAYDQGRRRAIDSAGTVWTTMTPSAQAAAVQREMVSFDRRIERFWAQLASMEGSSRSVIDQRLLVIQQRTQRMVSAVQRARFAAWEGTSASEVPREQIAQPIAEQLTFHAVLPAINTSIRMAATRWIAEADRQPQASPWQHVVVRRSKQRDYPMESHEIAIDRSTLPSPLQAKEPILCSVEGVGIHLTGGLRACWKELKARPFDLVEDRSGYLPGDLAGGWGIERQCESQLRGARGRLRTRLDGGRHERAVPHPGKAVQTTIDILLQARIQALMDPAFGLMRLQPWHGNPPPELLGTPLRGAAVVLDAGNGDVLAAVSTPGFTRRAWRENPTEITNNAIDRPHWNRAVQMAYQPGSTLKPLMFCAAVTDALFPIDGTIRCNGHLYEEFPDRYRCWYYKLFKQRHGNLNGPESLARSCNIFYYTLGRRLGMARLVSWMDRFGLGRATLCGLPEETTGDVPVPNRDPTSGTAESTYLGIGQGPVRWTVMQAAAFYAALARGGQKVQPALVRTSEKEVPDADLQLHPAAVDSVMKGLYLAANSNLGTAHHITTDAGREAIFNLEEAEIYAKTGTAEAAVQWSDRDGDNEREAGEYWVDFDRNGRRDPRESVPRSDHAWCIAIIHGHHKASARGAVGPYVIAIVAEYAGSGGRIAGPVANQIAHALRAEHYLR